MKVSNFLILALQLSVAPVRPVPQLLFANRKDIRLVEIRGSGPGTTRRQPLSGNGSILIGDLEDAVALDFYYKDELVFWSDIGLEMIKGMRVGNHSTERSIVSTGLVSPDGLSCDWLAKKLYWTDSETNRIEVVQMDGRYRKVLFWQDLDQPRAIALLPSDGLIFWTDWGETPKIERAGMDGDLKTRQVIVNSSISWPNGITIDYQTKRVYWADAKLKVISSMGLWGEDRKVVKGNLDHPFALTLFGDWLYWTDWMTKAIHGCHKSDGSHKRVVAEGSWLKPMDIHYYNKDRQPTGHSPCETNNGGCSHLCLTSSGSLKYSCACPTGVRLLEDKSTCAKGPEDILLLARKTDIRLISLDTPDYTDIVLQLRGIKHAIALDFNSLDNYLYWTDDEARAIRRAFLNGTGQEDLITTEVHHPEGVAVDWIASNLYWTDTGTDRIEVSRLNGSSRRVLIAENLNEPRAIVLEPQKGYMYWSDWGPEPKIERAHLDGTNRKVLINKNLGWPNGLALDPEARLIYWGDAKMDHIECSDTEGQNRRVLLSDQMPHIFGFTLLGDYIYWTDWQRRSIERIKKVNGSDHEVILDQLPDLMGLKAVKLSGWGGTNPCGHGSNGGCSHLCLNKPGGSYVCACPMGQELAADLRTCVIPEAFLIFSRRTDIRRISLASQQNDIIPLSGITEASALDYDIDDNRIYWSDINKKSISRAFMNGSQLQVVIEFGLELPESLAVDWLARNLYWTDMGLNRIEVARLDGSSRSVLIWKGLDHPRSLAVNPAQGMMYWSDWGQCRIESSGLDGSQRNTLIPGLCKANSLTIDYVDKRIYWVNMESNLIESSDMNGKKRQQLILEHSEQPHSLTQYQDYIYYTDLISHSIERINKKLGFGHTRIMSQTDFAVDISVYHNSRQSGWNHCHINNGDCSHLCLAFPQVESQAGAKKHEHFRCACPTHFILNEEQRTCTVPQNFLLYSQKNSVSRILSDIAVDESPDVVLPLRALKSVRAIAFSSSERHLYWIDGRTHNIRRVLENGTGASVVVQAPPESLRPFALAVDPYAKAVYWSCTQNNVINVTRGNGSPLGVVIAGENQHPRAIALYPQKGLMFWCNMASPPRIERSNMDGHQRMVLVDSGLESPSALTLDPWKEMIYWADGNHIHRVHIGGTNRVIFLNDTQPLAITVTQEFIYWFDKDQMSIERVNRNRGNRSRVLSHLTHFTDLVAVTELSMLAHPCSVQNGGCSHICTTTEDLRRRCACPLGLALSKDERSCVTPPTCSSDQFACATGNPACIPNIWRCDGFAECEDNSDENDCPVCKENQFKCLNGACIDEGQMCDGLIQCKDGSHICCLPPKFLCPSSRQCISGELVCNGHPDCSDGFDEKPNSCDNRVSFHIRDAAEVESHSTNYVVGTIVAIICFLVMGYVIYQCRSKAQEDAQSEEVVDMMVAKPLNVIKKTSIIPSTSYREVPERGRLTGASSTSSSGRTTYPQTLNPPPSPATSHGTARGTTRSYRNYRSRNRPPPPTPCSTDVCDESEPYYGLRGGRDSPVSDALYPPPPPTPWSLSDCGSCSTDRSFCKPPPPSPAQTEFR